MPNLGNSTGGVISLRLRLAAKPPPSKRGRQGGRAMLAPTRAAHLFVGEAFRLPQTGRETRPLRMQCTKVLSLRGAKRRGNLPVQFYGHIGTDVEATPYREIPTYGIAVLGMTYFYLRAPIWAFPAREVKGGSRPSPTIIPSWPPLTRGLSPPKGGDWGREIPLHILSLRPFGPPPSSEGGKACGQ